VTLPLPVGRQQLSDIIDLAIRGNRDPLTLKRFEREATKLLEKGGPEPEVSWLVLAFIACLQGNAQECVRRVDAAVRLAPRDITVLGNGCALLANVGEPRRAAELSVLLADAAGGNPNQLDTSAQILGMALNFEEAWRIMQGHNRTDSAIAGATQQLTEAVARLRISSDLRLRLLETAIGVLRSQDRRIFHTALRHYPDDCLRYELFVGATATDCGELNFEIAEALVHNFDDPHPEFITFACRPVSSYDIEGSFVEVAR
jgi:hypothetical protein